jgi:hypothetical protein
MGRNFAEQAKKDGALGYCARAAATPATFVAAVKDLVQGDTKFPTAIRISDGAAKLGQQVERKIVEYVQEHPVQAGGAIVSALATSYGLKKISDRVDKLESQHKTHNHTDASGDVSRKT